MPEPRVSIQPNWWLSSFMTNKEKCKHVSILASRLAHHEVIAFRLLDSPRLPGRVLDTREPRNHISWQSQEKRT
jgi:hypothetical protein